MSLWGISFEVEFFRFAFPNGKDAFTEVKIDQVATAAAAILITSPSSNSMHSQLPSYTQVVVWPASLVDLSRGSYFYLAFVDDRHELEAILQYSDLCQHLRCDDQSGRPANTLSRLPSAAATHQDPYSSMHTV